MKNERKVTNDSGITLIALVITIIVLLILAGISIAMLAGDNGVLTKASDSKIVNSLATVKDKVNLKAAEALSDYYETIYLSNDSQEYRDEALVETIMEKLMEEFTEDNGAKKDYPEYSIEISGKVKDSTITVVSNARPELFTQGTIQESGAIKWEDTFKRN